MSALKGMSFAVLGLHVVADSGGLLHGASSTFACLSPACDTSDAARCSAAASRVTRQVGRSSGSGWVRKGRAAGGDATLPSPASNGAGLTQMCRHREEPGLKPEVAYALNTTPALCKGDGPDKSGAFLLCCDAMLCDVVLWASGSAQIAFLKN